MRWCVDTTRQPRSGEIDGKHYHFITKPSFLQRVEEHKFIEHAEFGGNCYGTSIDAVKQVAASGKVCILDIDRQGVHSVKKANIPAWFVFIRPPSVEVLEARLRGRKTETEESIQKRMATVKDDFDYADQPGSYDLIVINDDLARAYQQLHDFITQKY
jgi:guanylate kinase